MNCVVKGGTIMEVWIILQAWILPRIGGQDLNERSLQATAPRCANELKHTDKTRAHQPRYE
jgi:hypothetical protein